MSALGDLQAFRQELLMELEVGGTRPNVWKRFLRSLSNVKDMIRYPLLGLWYGPKVFKVAAALVVASCIFGWIWLGWIAIKSSRNQISEDVIEETFAIILLLIFFLTSLGTPMLAFTRDRRKTGWEEKGELELQQRKYHLPKKTSPEWRRFITTFLTAQVAGFIIGWLAYSGIGGEVKNFVPDGYESLAIFAIAEIVAVWLGLVNTLLIGWVSSRKERGRREKRGLCLSLRSAYQEFWTDRQTRKKARKALARTKWTRRISKAGFGLWAGLTTLIFLKPTWLIAPDWVEKALLFWGIKLSVEAASSILIGIGKWWRLPQTTEEYKQVGLNTAYLHYLSIFDMGSVLLAAYLAEVVGGSAFFSLLIMKTIMSTFGLILGGLNTSGTAIIKSIADDGRKEQTQN